MMQRVCHCCPVTKEPWVTHHQSSNWYHWVWSNCPWWDWWIIREPPPPYCPPSYFPQNSVGPLVELGGGCGGVGGEINRDFVCLIVCVCMWVCGCCLFCCLFGVWGWGDEGGEVPFSSVLWLWVIGWQAQRVGTQGAGSVLAASVQRLSVPPSIPTCQLDRFK